MRQNQRTQRICQGRAFTRIELVVVLAVIVVAGTLIRTLAKDFTKASRLQCDNNLKNIGLAFHNFAIDRGNRYPMSISTNEGGSSEYTGAGLAVGQFVWFHYAAMSNELTTPKILVCPADGSKTQATNWTTHLRLLKNKSTSYFVGYDADETRLQSLLSGDRNITNLLPIRTFIDKSEVIKMGTNHTADRGAGWTRDLHQEHGNILLGDGSVHYLDTARLRDQLRNSRGDNLLGFPGQSPQ